MDPTSWLQLAVICLLGAISPGPSLAVVVGNTITGGRAYGVLTGLGHATGISLWACLTATGVAEVMVDKSGMMEALQSSGACVLAYIGFRIITTGAGVPVQQGRASLTASWMPLRSAGEGFLISLFNPKIALFFLAIFSHFVQPESGWTEMGLMGLTAGVIDASWYAFVALMLTGTNRIRVLQSNETVISRVSGSLLILIALYLLGATIRGLL